MISYPYINELFTNILKKSYAIEGRFYICPKQGLEINSEEFEQVMLDVVNQQINSKKWPASLLMPPQSSGSFIGSNGEWEKYKLAMFFLKTTYIDSVNQVANKNVNTGRSKHTIPEDWHDMARAAKGFIRLLSEVIKWNRLYSTAFRIEADEKFINPITLIGKDAVSGVRLDFSISLFTACSDLLEDYPLNIYNEVLIPNGDTHPKHKL